MYSQQCNNAPVSNIPSISSVIQCSMRASSSGRCESGILDVANGVALNGASIAYINSTRNLVKHHDKVEQTKAPIEGVSESGNNKESTCNSVKINVTAPPMFAPKKKNVASKQTVKNLGKSKDKDFKQYYQPKVAASPSNLHGPSHLIASQLPAAFPEHLAFRALALYSSIRTLSVDLRISPFTPNAFLRALSLPSHCKLIGEIHASILRLLFASYDLGVYHYRGDGLSKMKLPPKRDNDGISEYIARSETLHPRAGENLLYLDHMTWPLYLHDFTQIIETEIEGEVESPLLEGNGDDMDSFFKSKPSEIVKSAMNESNKRPRCDDCDTPKVLTLPSKKNNKTISSPAHSNLQNGQSEPKTNQGNHHVLPSGPNLYQPFQSPMFKFNSYQAQNPYQYQYPYSSGYYHNNHSNGSYPYYGYPPHYQNQSHVPMQPYSYPNTNMNYDKIPHNASPNPHQKSMLNNGDQEEGSPNVEKKINQNLGKNSSPSQIQNNRLQNQQTLGEKRKRLDSSDGECKNDVSKSPDMNDLEHKSQNDERMEDGINEYKNIFNSIDQYLIKNKSVETKNTNGESCETGPSKKRNDDHSDEDDGLDADEDDNKLERKQTGRSVLENPSKLRILKKLKNGSPYFKLTVETKVEILEYLVDEILNIELIKQQLDTRKIFSISNMTTYGKMPTSQDLNDIVNEDVCYVCRKEGDLICCDGCVASYHQECVDIQLSNIMSNDKWFCHECNIVDSSFFGPLDGGHKPSLDWFLLEDLDNVEQSRNEFNETFGGTEKENSMLPFDLEQSFHEIFDNVEFLVIHGFAFARHIGSKSKAIVDRKSFVAYNSELSSNIPIHLSENTQCSDRNLCGNISIKPLDQVELYMYLALLGPSRCTEWPWSQIPFSPEKMDIDWKRLGYNYKDKNLEKMLQMKNSKQRYYNYVNRTDAFNPFSYNNFYARSSYHHLVESQLGKKKLKLNQKNFNLDNSLKYQLTRDMQEDKNLVQSLQNNFYDPYQSIKDYMTTLESQLFRSTLLAEFWGLRNKSRDLDWWKKSVTKCKSIKVLSKLLITLIDETNSRAFLTEWFMLPGMSNDDLNSSNNDAPRNYTDIDANWKEKDQKFRRSLHRCHESDILKLIGHVSKHSNRKGNKVLTNNTKSQPDKDNETRRLSAEIHGGATNSLPYDSSRNTRKGFSEESKNRRKSDRYHTIVNPTMSTTEDLIKDKLYKLEKQCSDIAEMENHWPIAGRRLFEPCGSLPKPTVKWLGRNAGIRRAPYVRYPAKFEIGLPSTSHIWRQNTLKVATFEQLIYQIRVLDSYLNRNVINSLESLTRRVGQLKGSIQKVVKSSHVDIRTGTIEYFVLQKSKQRGCWLSSDIVEGSTFVIHRNLRIRNLRGKRQREIAAENEAKRLQLAKKRDETKSKAAITNSAVKASKDAAVDPDILCILKKHENIVKELMKECKDKGMSMVPTAVIKPWRDKHFSEMHKVLKLKNRLLDFESLSSNLGDAEVAGTKAYIEEVTKAPKQPHHQADIVDKSAERKKPAVKVNVDTRRTETAVKVTKASLDSNSQGEQVTVHQDHANDANLHTSFEKANQVNSYTTSKNIQNENVEERVNLLQHEIRQRQQLAHKLEQLVQASVGNHNNELEQNTSMGESIKQIDEPKNQVQIPTTNNTISNVQPSCGVKRKQKELEHEIMKQEQLAKELEHQQIQNQIRKKQLRHQQIEQEIKEQKLKQKKIQQEIEVQKVQEQQLQMELEAAERCKGILKSFPTCYESVVDRQLPTVVNSAGHNYLSYNMESTQQYQKRHGQADQSSIASTQQEQQLPQTHATLPQKVGDSGDCLALESQLQQPSQTQSQQERFSQGLGDLGCLLTQIMLQQQQGSIPQGLGNLGSHLAQGLQQQSQTQTQQAAQPQLSSLLAQGLHRTSSSNQHQNRNPISSAFINPPMNGMENQQNQFIPLPSFNVGLSNLNQQSLNFHHVTAGSLHQVVQGGQSNSSSLQGHQHTEVNSSDLNLQQNSTSHGSQYTLGNFFNRNFQS